MPDTLEIIDAHAEVVLDTSVATHQEWLDARRTGTGGSDSAAALNLGYKGRYALWAEKTGRYVDDTDNERMYWGRKLEVPILEAFAERADVPVRRHPYMLRSREYPWMTVNLDGLTENAVIEVKNVGARMLAEWQDEHGRVIVPDHYSIQGQHACIVTGLPGVWFAALIGGQQLKWVYIPRDDELCDMLIAALEVFWRLVESDTPPPVDGSEATRRAISTMYAQPVPGDVEVDPVLLNWVVSRATLKEQAKAIKDQIDAYENSIKASLGEYEVGTLHGEPIVTWKAVSRSGYTVEPTTYRRLHVPKSKALVAALTSNLRGELHP